jgi:hypothetical protein
MQQHRASVGKIEPYWQSRKASMATLQKPAAMGPYLDQISSQATVMHTVLTALCNGLERLEKRMDDNDAGTFGMLQFLVASQSSLPICDLFLHEFIRLAVKSEGS